LLPTRPAKDFHLQSSAHVRHTFALVAKATFMPPIDIASLPASLLDRFAGDIAEQPCRQRGGSVLHPPMSLGKAGRAW